MKKINLDNRGITIREVADNVRISFGSCRANFNDVVGMKRAEAKIVPKMDQRNRIKFCVKKKTKCARILEMLTVAFAESAISRTQL